MASVIHDKTADSLCPALLMNTSFLCSSKWTCVDGATDFQFLCIDLSFQQYSIELDFGYTRNKNPNSVSDKGIQELETELLKHDPSGTPVTLFQLQLVLETLNTHIRNRGLSAMEILLQRNQQTSEKILVKDDRLSRQQQNQRTYNHPFSSKSKAPGCRDASKANVSVGDLNCLHQR